ncbi:hypothetical protein ACU686_16420 [Yinghuangia aomiensis]
MCTAEEDTVRDVIHAFNERRAWPRWTLAGRGGRPRLISDDERAFVIAAATTPR